MDITCWLYVRARNSAQCVLRTGFESLAERLIVDSGSKGVKIFAENQLAGRHRLVEKMLNFSLMRWNLREGYWQKKRHLYLVDSYINKGCAFYLPYWDADIAIKNNKLSRRI